MPRTGLRRRPRAWPDSRPCKIPDHLIVRTAPWVLSADIRRLLSSYPGAIKGGTQRGYGANRPGPGSLGADRGPSHRGVAEVRPMSPAPARAGGNCKPAFDGSNGAMPPSHCSKKRFEMLIRTLCAPGNPAEKDDLLPVEDLVNGTVAPNAEPVDTWGERL